MKETSDRLFDFIGVLALALVILLLYVHQKMRMENRALRERIQLMEQQSKSK